MLEFIIVSLMVSVYLNFRTWANTWQRSNEIDWDALAAKMWKDADEARGIYEA